MNRVRCVWANWAGAPGYSNFYMDTSVTDPTPIRTFFEAIKTMFPTGLTISVPGSGDQINELTGTIIGAWSGTVPALVTATGGVGNYTGCAGGQVQWQTTSVVAGRRPLAKTFLVPLYGTKYDTNGSLDNTAVSTIQTAAAALVTAMSPNLRIWARPFAGTATKAARVGSSVPVTSARVQDMSVSLRSRRQ